MYYLKSLHRTIIASVIIGFCLTALTPSSFAKQASSPNRLILYSQPNLKSKVVEQVSPEHPLIPIYYPNENSQWVKVANASNGNTGWLPIKALHNRGTKLRLHYHSPRFFHIITYSNDSNSKISEQEAKAMVKKLEAREAAMQRSIDTFIHHIMNNFFDFSRALPIELDNNRLVFPVIQPIIMLPKDQKQPKNTNSGTQSDTSSVSWWKALKAKLSGNSDSNN